MIGGEGETIRKKIGFYFRKSMNIFLQIFTKSPHIYSLYWSLRIIHKIALHQVSPFSVRGY